jgi:hypothetical protein
MEFIPVREFSKSPQAAIEKLALNDKAVLTTDGQPAAILLKVDGNNFEAALSTLNQMAAKAQQNKILQTVRAIQQRSVQNGTSTMTLDEINAEIAAARAEMKARGLNP